MNDQTEKAASCCILGNMITEAHEEHLTNELSLHISWGVHFWVDGQAQVRNDQVH